MNRRPAAVRPATLVAMCLTIASAAAGADRGAAAATPLLARARAALGTDWTRAAAGIRFRGTADYLGRQGPLEILLAADGRFARRFATELPAAIGFDGTHCWNTDWTGMSRELQLAERDWAEVSMALVSGAWLREGFPWQIAPAPESSEDAPALRLTREEPGAALTLRLDPATGLPARLTRRGISGEQALELGDWIRVAGRRFPARLEETRSGQRMTLTAASIEPVAAGDAALAAGTFTAPPDPADAVFEAGMAAGLEVRRVPTGHFLVKPRIDGRDVGWFIFDTGAGGSTLSPEVARALELPVVGEGGVMSVFGYTPARIHRAHTLTLGPLTIRRPVFVEFDLAPFEGPLGEKIAGIVGYDVMRRAIVELEVAGSRLALHARADFDTTGMPWQPLYLNDRHPIVAASFEGHAGLFKLDVGASGGPFGNVTMHAPAVERLGLIEDRDVQPAHAAGGAVAFGRAAWFELAGHRFESPTVVFATDRGSGPFQDVVTLGNIGLNFMEPFRIVFDYADGRIAMVERATKP